MHCSFSYMYTIQILYSYTGPLGQLAGAAFQISATDYQRTYVGW